MAKSKKSKPQKSRIVRRAGVGNSYGLDADAIRYRNLLLDPCGAPLCRSVFSGLGGSLQVRVKGYYQMHPQSVEGVYCFMPTGNVYWGQYNSAGSAGQPFQLSGGQYMFPNPNSIVHEWRCIAGCMKVRYTGPESARSGLVSVFPLASPLYEQLSSGITVPQTLAISPVVHRTGEVRHEAKFVPTDADQIFVDTQQQVQLTWQGNGGIAVVFQGVPAGSLTLEFTGVYELENVTGLSGGFATIISPQPSPSRNTLNQVLRSLGEGLQWAYDNVAVPVIKSAATNVARSVLNSQAVRSGGQMMLTMG